MKFELGFPVSYSLNPEDFEKYTFQYAFITAVFNNLTC